MGDNDKMTDEEAEKAAREQVERERAEWDAERRKRGGE